MKIIHFLLLIIIGLVCACGQNSEKQRTEDIRNSNEIIHDYELSQITNELRGPELLKKILDTITIKPLTIDFLVNNTWNFHAFENCITTYTFFENNTGELYNCENEWLYEITYKIVGDTLFIQQYDQPEVDNPENIRYKSRDDKFLFNGRSLILIDYKIFNMAGKLSEFQLETIIEFEKQ